MTATGPKECPNDDRRVGAAMAAIIGYEGPEVTALGGLAARIEHRRASLSHKDAVNTRHHGTSMPPGGVHPIDYKSSWF